MASHPQNKEKRVLFITYPMSTPYEDPVQRRLGVLRLGGSLLAPRLSHFSSYPAIISAAPPATWPARLTVSSSIDPNTPLLSPIRPDNVGHLKTRSSWPAATSARLSRLFSIPEARERSAPSRQREASLVRWPFRVDVLEKKSEKSVTGRGFIGQMMMLPNNLVS